MKTLYFALLLLIFSGCTKKSTEPVPERTIEILCFPVSITSADPAGVNEIFTYTSYGELASREYYTLIDTVHRFQEFYTLDRDHIGQIYNRDHSLSDSIIDYITFDYMAFDFLPIRRNERPYYPLNNLTINAYELYKYDAKYELEEQLFYVDYKLTGSRKYTNTNHLMTRAEVFDANGEKVKTIDLNYDDKRHPHSNNVKYKKLLVEMGFPHARNITQVTTRNNAGNIIQSESYTNTYTYNDQGYPLKVVRTYLNGSANSYTYTYVCQ